MAKQAQALAFVDRQAVVDYLQQRLKDARKAQRGFQQACEQSMAVGATTKAQGHAKRATYWANVVSGVRWLLTTLPS